MTIKKGFDKALDVMLTETTEAQGTATAEEQVVTPQKVETRGRKKAEHTQLDEASGNIRTSLIVNEELFLKLKEIAKRERVTHTQLLTFAMKYIVSNYEKVHGEIVIGAETETSIEKILGW